jgi:hypothetical protein
MPRISELPAYEALTGDETTTIVQNGETRQVALHEMLNARHHASITDIRWVTYTGYPGVVGDREMAINISNSNGGGC